MALLPSRSSTSATRSRVFDCANCVGETYGPSDYTDFGQVVHCKLGYFDGYDDAWFEIDEFLSSKGDEEFSLIRKGDPKDLDLVQLASLCAFFREDDDAPPGVYDTGDPRDKLN